MKIVLLLIMALVLSASEFTKMKTAFDKGDFNRAINVARTEAMHGNISAMYDLGLIYYAKGDIRNAKIWLERSVKNDGKGALGVAIISFVQAQNRKDYRKVMEYLINAPKGKIRDALMAVSRDLSSNRDDASAEQYLVLAELYFYDKIVHPNLRVALYLTNQAARKGNAQAQELMGDAYWRSNYTVDTLMVAPQTGNALNVALEYYQSAANLGNLDAMAKLGKLHIVGPRNLRRIEYGVSLILKAADAGSSIGALMAGELYMNAQGVRANKNVAIEYYKKATEFCTVNNFLARYYGHSDEGKKYQEAYEKCMKEDSTLRSYHILFEKF